jgi:hypothetical protein
MADRLHQFEWNKKRKTRVKKFFLACEFKPNCPLWSIVEPFAYDVQPAYVHGKLGIISYNPPTYAIVELDQDDDPLIGYVMTITNPDTILLLDKIKGYYGKAAYNTHIRSVQKVYIDKNKDLDAWCYMLSKYVLNAYTQVETIEFGLWDEDKAQVALLEKIGIK